MLSVLLSKGMHLCHVMLNSDNVMGDHPRTMETLGESAFPQVFSKTHCLFNMIFIVGNVSLQYM